MDNGIKRQLQIKDCFIKNKKKTPNKYVTINIRLIIRLLKATFGIKTRIKHADATKADKSFHNFRW